MRNVIRVFLCLAWAALGPQGLAFAVPQDFVDIDPGVMKARVIKVEPQDAKKSPPGSIVTVEVTVPRSPDGAYEFAEPFAFEFLGKGRDAEPWVWERVALPHTGRIGRAVEAGGKDTYQALVPYEKSEAKGAKVRVLHAGGWRGAELPSESGVTIGKPSTVRSDLTQSKQAVFKASNASAFDVDLVLRATFKKPFRVDSLIRIKCPASKEVEHTVEVLNIGSRRLFDVDVGSLEIVDWSRAVSDRKGDALAVYARVDAQCYRWPGEVFPVRAFVSYLHESSPTGEPVVAQVLIRADGTVDARAEPGTKLKSADALARFVEEHFWCVARPRPEEVAGDGLRLFRGGAAPLVWIGAKGVGAPGVEPRILEVVAGAPHRSYSGKHTDALMFHWDWTAAEDHPWRPARIQQYWNHPPTLRPSKISYGWTKHESQWVPESVAVRAGVDGPHGERATFSGWTFGADAFEDRVLPSGELAEKARAAWDAFYRYPTASVTWTGKYRIVHSGTDALWRGYGKVEGEFKVSGITSNFWQESAAMPTNKGMIPQDKDALEGVVLDRFLMWSNRDVCRFERFDKAFLGAKLTANGDWIEIDGGPVAAIRIAGGMPVEIRYGRGNVVAVKWANLKGHRVPAKVSSGKESVTVKWSAVDKEWLVPKKVHFQDIFPDWGPETITWSKVKVSEN